MQNSAVPQQKFGKLWYYSTAGSAVSNSEFGVQVWKSTKAFAQSPILVLVFQFVFLGKKKGALAQRI